MAWLGGVEYCNIRYVNESGEMIKVPQETRISHHDISRPLTGVTREGLRFAMPSRVSRCVGDDRVVHSMGLDQCRGK